MDLHGYEVHEAWEAYRKATSECYTQKIKTLRVITGKGEIQKEFLEWVNSDPHAKSAKMQGNNTGAFVVSIRPHNAPKKSVKPESAPNLELLFKKFKRWE
jgi:DNA-nicking Smr family endonuclease